MSAFSISVVNQQERLDLDYHRIKAVARAVLEGEKMKKAKITIACLPDSAIQVLNKRFLNHDTPTDVISFPYYQSQTEIQGELAVSTDTACTIAEERHHSPADELLLYIIHGLLHLCGYQDIDEKSRKQMRSKERYYLKLQNIAVDPVDEA